MTNDPSGGELHVPSDFMAEQRFRILRTVMLEATMAAGANEVFCVFVDLLRFLCRTNGTITSDFSDFADLYESEPK
jgi:hypothetical protein